MSRLGIIAGAGDLPRRIAAAHPGAFMLTFDGAADLPKIESRLTSYERFGEIFDHLTQAGVSEVVFAGGLARPALDPTRFDAKMMQLAPRFMAAMQGGDDGLLRAVIGAFEDEGFAVKGAHEVLPGLTAGPGLLAGNQPSQADQRDIARARGILHALGPLDVGQGAVVADGQVLGVETAQGTDVMLDFVAGTRGRLKTQSKGVMVKAPKPGQDLRIDMPAIGPGTMDRVAAAGLAGLAIDAGQVLVLDLAATIAAADAAGVFLLAEPQQGADR